MTPKNILLLEDDPLQSQTYRKKLKEHFLGATVTHLETESALYALVAKIKAGSAVIPDAVVADVMMPWAQPSKNSPAVPPEVKKGGFSRAGVRCLKHFLDHLQQTVPWVFFSILPQQTITNEIGGIKGVSVVSKEQGLEDLCKEIETLCGVGASAEEMETEDILSNPSMKKAIVTGLSAPISECSPKLD